MSIITYTHYGDDWGLEFDIEYEVEYHRTPFRPAEPSWFGGAGSPAEGGEVIIDSIRPEVPARSALWFDIYEFVEANGE